MRAATIGTVEDDRILMTPPAARHVIPLITLGDWAATGGLGYSGGALVFRTDLGILAVLHFWTSTNRVLLSWSAFIFTRPLGPTV
jgi:uncharacterized membrane-anchored protein